MTSRTWRLLGVPAVLMALAAGLLTGCQPAGTNATIEATAFSVAPTTAGEAFAVCPGNKRALGGGIVESGAPPRARRASERSARRDRDHVADAG
jgi:hypothetical protein